MAGVEHGVDLGGGRSSGELGVGVREHGRRSWGVLRTPEIAVSTTVGSDTSWGGCGHGHAMAGGERFSGKVVGLAREGGGARGEGESGRGLTAELQGGLVGSGARRSGRIDGERRRGRSLEMMTMAAARGPSGRVRRRGGRGRHCGALGGVGEARGGWWPRRTASVATAPFGSEVRSERESRRRG